MDINLNKDAQIRGSSELSSESRVLRDTYRLLSYMLMSGAVAAFVSAMLSFPPINFFIVLAGFYGLIFMVNKSRNSPMAIVYAFALSFFMGIVLGPMIGSVLAIENGAGLIANAFFLTAISFFALSVYASNAKRDLSFLAGFLLVGFVVLMGAVVVSLFTSIPGMSMAILVGFILSSSATILFQTNAIVRGGEDNYVMAVVSLYISIYNLFTSLLSLMSRD